MTLRKPPSGPPNSAASSAISRSMLMRLCLRRTASRWRMREYDDDDEQLDEELVVDEGDSVAESLWWCLLAWLVEGGVVRGW